MHVFFDHLSAIVISSAIIIIAALIQVRGSQQAAESTISHMVYADILEFKTFLDRDLENMLNEVQTDQAIAEGRYAGGPAFTCAGVDSAGYTTSFTFPTLADQDSTGGTVLEITYVLVNTGQSISIPGRDSTETHPLFRIERLAGSSYTGTSQNNVIAFRIETAGEGDGYSNFTPLQGACPDDLLKIRFEFKLANQGAGYATADQRSMSQSNMSRFGNTLHLSNWELSHTTP